MIKYLKHLQHICACVMPMSCHSFCLSISTKMKLQKINTPSYSKLRLHNLHNFKILFPTKNICHRKLVVYNNLGDNLLTYQLNKKIKLTINCIQTLPMGLSLPCFLGDSSQQAWAGKLSLLTRVQLPDISREKRSIQAHPKWVHSTSAICFGLISHC